jgi:hypothetical protein
MDLMRIEKKNAGDKYSSVASILEDMNLLKSNAYLYNQGMAELYLLFSSLLISCTFPVNLSHSRIYFADLSLSPHYSTPLACAYLSLSLSLSPSLYFYVHLGVNGLEVRIMADALVNYFRHLLRRSLSDLLTKTNSVKGTMNQTQIQARTKSVYRKYCGLLFKELECVSLFHRIIHRLPLVQSNSSYLENCFAFPMLSLCLQVTLISSPLSFSSNNTLL